MPAPSSDLVDPARLGPWLAAHVPGFEGPFRALKTATGQSNPTFVLEAASGRYVLRRKPPGDLLPSAHAIEREFRVMRALAATPVPVPEMLALCEDASVLGKPFFVMAWAPGETIDDPRCPGLDPAGRRRLYAAMNRTLAALHGVDAAAVGLADFGRTGNYYARQLDRWTRAYRASETEPVPAMERLIGWLARQHPPEGPTTLVHGDWRLDNLRVDPVAGEVLAVLDWELSTLGHPLADLAAQIMQWALPPGAEGRGLAGVDRAATGLPEDGEYVTWYAANAGLDRVPDMTFPLAFAFFRMAAILQGVKRRALDGNASNPAQGLRLGAMVPLYAELALERLDGG